MGLFWSKRDRYRPHHHNHQPSSLPPPPPPPPYTTYLPPAPPPLPPHSMFQYPQLPPPPPPPQSNHNNNYNNNCYNYPNYYTSPGPVNYQQHHHHQPPPYFNNTHNYNSTPQITGWGHGLAPVPPPPPPHQPAPHNNAAKKVKNNVNLHKESIALQLDLLNPNSHLVSFTFDAMENGSITIFYFAKEGDQCTFTPLYPEIVPVKIPFQKGLGQKFCQPSGTGVDLGFFDTDELSKPIPGENIYPLVISIESLPSAPIDESSSGKPVNASSHAQISQAILEKKDNGNFLIKVMKQILWIDGERYELREIFGLSQSHETTVNDLDSGKECVICMTEVKNTAVLPCRHMCMCSECAQQLRLQSDKCPICRQPIEELLEIKVDEETAV